jgi:hypothetical protein
MATYGSPQNFRYHEHSDPTGAGLVVFAASVIGLLGALNLFYGLAVVAGSDIFITEAAWLVGDAEPWGWLMLGVGIVQLAATPAILTGAEWGRWIGIVSAAANIASQIMFMSDLPGVAIVLLLVDLGVIHALVVYGGRPPGQSAYSRTAKPS